jgi:hypothetical protein
MRVSDKLVLIDKIGSELQSRFRFSEIDTFLAEFGIPSPKDVTVNSKRVYAKAALSGIGTETIVRIAEELDIEIPRSQTASSAPPRNWRGKSELRLFISHISSERAKAIRLKECLRVYEISGFVAHEDIHPTLEWQAEIERALFHMDAFVAMHTPGFSNSIWTQQEIGVAVGRGVKIISLQMGEDPTGFISRHQALPRRRRTAEEIAGEIFELLSNDDRTKQKLQNLRRAKGLMVAEDDIPF